MQKRGLEKAIMLGMLSDNWLYKEQVEFFKDVTGGMLWANTGHYTRQDGDNGLPLRVPVELIRFIDSTTSRAARGGTSRGWRRSSSVIRWTLTPPAVRRHGRAGDLRQHARHRPAGRTPGA